MNLEGGAETIIPILVTRCGSVIYSQIFIFCLSNVDLDSFEIDFRWAPVIKLQDKSWKHMMQQHKWNTVSKNSIHRPEQYKYFLWNQMY